MTVKKPLLDINFTNGEKDPGDGVIFQIEHRDPMLLCGIPHLVWGHQGRSCYGFGADVEEIVHDPVEHLHQVGQFLQYPTMEVIRESRGVWGVDDGSTAGAFFGSRLRAGGLIL